LSGRAHRKAGSAFEWESKHDLKRNTTTSIYGPVKFVHTTDRFRMYWHGRRTIDLPKTANLAIAILSLMSGAKAEVDQLARRAKETANAGRLNATRIARKKEIVMQEIAKALQAGTADTKIVTVATHSSCREMQRQGISPRRGTVDEVSERYVRKIKTEMLKS
jgi:hypothetical protein